MSGRLESVVSSAASSRDLFRDCLGGSPDDELGGVHEALEKGLAVPVVPVLDQLGLEACGGNLWG